jgi:hypothetical protein
MSAANVWFTWSTTTNTTTANDWVWNKWTLDNGTASTTYKLDTTWTDWNITADWKLNHVAAPVLTEEQRAEQRRQAEAREAEYAERARVQAKEAAEAQERAKALLASVLSRGQRVSLRTRGYFTVRCESGQRYRVKRGWSHNVERVVRRGRQWVPVESLCIHPRETVPTDDNLVAQKLMLETDEQAFRTIAYARPVVH